MQTMSEVLVSSQEVFRQDIPKQAPTHTEGASSRPKIARIRDVRGITPNAKFALLLLHSREPNIFPSMQLLAADMGMSVQTARRAVRALERAGYVQVIPRIGKTNLYSITVTGPPPPLSSMPPPPVTGATPPLSSMSPPPVTGAPPPLSSMSPPPITRDTPPLSPVIPEVAREVYKGRNKRERARTLPTSIQSIKETLTCPKCERSWPADYGSVCHDCNMEIATIQRNIAERQRQDEQSKKLWKASVQEKEKELNTYRQNQEAVKHQESKTCSQKQLAKPPEDTPEEIETARQDFMKTFCDIAGKPYDRAILLAQGSEA